MHYVYVPFLTRNKHQEYDPKVKTLRYESLYIYIFPPSNAPTCPCGLRGLPFWEWQKCNRLLRLGRP